MSYSLTPGFFPSLNTFEESIEVLNLPISGCELHGVICGYLCAGATQKAEHYMRALMIKNDRSADVQEAVRALFELFEISKQHINDLDFSFKLLLPDEESELTIRACAFSQWCEGFIQGIHLSEIDENDLEEDESHDALQHFREFAELDYENLDVDEDSEKALMEVSEYARMAVLRLHGEIKTRHLNKDDVNIHH